MIVVFTFWKGDVWLARKHLEWMGELDTNIPYPCILACDNETDPKPVKELAELLFKSVTVFQYPRATYNGEVIEQWPWQQNNSFANVARRMPKYKQPWLWVETDCTALKSNWVQTLEAEYLKGKKPFGGHWNYATNVFNGVAIYPPNVAQYSTEALYASMTVNEKGKQNPWDAACSQQVRPHLHIMNNVMQHLWCLPGQTVEEAPTFPDLAAVGKWLRPDISLFHRCKDGSLIDRMREMANRKITVKLSGQDIVHLRKKIMGTDIFIVTFRRDFEFAKYCLKSITKFATGFNKVVLAVPTVDRDIFADLCPSCPNIVVKTFEEAPGKGMMHHEAIVCMADQFCDADYILHLDADCIFKEPVTPEDYFIDGKPVLLKESYAKLVGNNGYDHGVGLWQKAVSNALGFKPEFETMRRHPAVHPREIYQKVRNHIERIHNRPFLDYVLSCQSHYPQGFAEFDTLGAWLLQFEPQHHHWINCDTESRPPDKLYQFWSHGGINYVATDGPTKGIAFRETIKRVLGE